MGGLAQPLLFLHQKLIFRLAKPPRLRPFIRLQRSLRGQSSYYSGEVEFAGCNVAGVDEAGRGPLAGPVFVAAVLLPAHFDDFGLDDSKRLNAKTRDIWAGRISAVAIHRIHRVDHGEIDRLNILQATMVGMALAVSRLSVVPDLVLIDGNRIPPGLPCPARAEIKGDGRFSCIAAASVLAKTARDAYMVEMASLYPDYGFERHFGYPTPEHFALLRKFGPCPIHRKSFAPVRALLGDATEQPCLIGLE